MRLMLIKAAVEYDKIDAYAVAHSHTLINLIQGLHLSREQNFSLQYGDPHATTLPSQNLWCSDPQHQD